MRLYDHAPLRRFKGLGVGRGMTTVDELSLSPASDCNSNNVEASYTSTTSDVEFIQDNCEYQWFNDVGYREVQHPSLLSSGYDELARDLDSQLAQVDMEDYTAQDILSTLPVMCCTDIQPERRGEMFASVTGSLMVKFDFDSSISPHTSSQDESSMSLCQSEPLFSPVKEVPLPLTNYSVDSLDCDDQEHLIVTCQANKHNYTIAFHGSTVMEDTSEYTDTGESVCSLDGVKKASKMAASDHPTTTWSKLRKVPMRQRQRSKTISLPDLAPKLSSSIAAIGGCVKLFDIQNSSSVTSESFSGSGESRTSLHAQKAGNFSLLRLFIAQRNSTDHTNENNTRNTSNTKAVRNTNELGSMTDTAWMEDLSACYEDSLVRDTSTGEVESSSVERISSKSGSICSCSMSASSNRFNVNNNNSFEREQPTKHNAKVGTQTSGSDLSDTSSSEPTANTKIAPSSCPLHCVDRSMQTSCLKGSLQKSAPEEEVGCEEKKPVYVLYPNYTLPDLGFLRKAPLDLDRVLLAPMKYTGGNTPQTPPATHAPYRTVTRQDVDMLKQKGLSHIVDLSSLTPLLPSEYWSMLAEVPQIRQCGGLRFEPSRPLFCMTPTQNKEFSPFPDGRTNVNTSGCSSGTQPSSGYRGSSTLLSESGGGGTATNPMFVYNYSSEEKSKSKRKSMPDVTENKRFSMFEMGEEAQDESDHSRKRKSFPSNLIKDWGNDEMWDDWWRDTKERPNSPPSTHAQRLDQLLEMSGSEQWQPQDIHTLRDQVSKFLSEAGRKCVSFADKGGDQQLTPPNSPTFQKVYQCKQPGMSDIPSRDDSMQPQVEPCDKKSLVDGVVSAVEKVKSCNEDNVSQVVLDSLCPALYALLSDSLKPHLETAFGPIGNSVWQVVEASAQQGPMTRALHELVMKLNSEDVLSEGLIKFNAFVFGLLNVRGMDTWISYVRTRESILSKHYSDDGILLGASKGNAKCRTLTDLLIKSLKPLAQIDFALDLLYETRLLHESLLQLARVPMSPNQNIDINSDSLLLKKIVRSIRSGLSNFSSNEHSQTSEGRSRPRSCIDAVTGGDSASTVRKRWSGVQVGSRLANAFDRLQVEEDFPDSSSSSVAPRSRIPRPVTSPVRPPASRLPMPQRRTPAPLTALPRRNAKVQRPSRVDIPPEKTPPTVRPSSLPYRPPGGAKVQRRAASSSMARRSDNSTGNRELYRTLVPPQRV